MYTTHLQDNWAKLLPLAEFAYNNSQSSSTKQSPFFLLHGFHPRSDLTIMDSPVPAASKLIESLQHSQAIAKETLKNAQHRYTENANRHRKSVVFENGQLVKLSSKNLPSQRPTQKLDNRFLGPFKVIKQVNSVAYQLELPPQMKIHNTFHVSLLEPWISNTFPSRQLPPPPPPPDIIDGEEHFEIQEILDSRLRHKKLQYFVSWKDYDSTENSWVSADDFDDDDEAVLHFKQSNPSRPSKHQA